MKKYFVILVVILSVFLAACEGQPSSVTKEQNASRTQMDQLLNSQPIPVFEWSLERAEMIELYRARNEAVSTFSVVQNPYTGAVMFECASVGYPIPGGTQLTNPSQIVEFGSGSSENGTTIDMAEPNGLYSPDTSAGTYIMCLNEDGTVAPVYQEFYVQTFPFPVEEIDGKLVRVKGVESSIKIETEK